MEFSLDRFPFSRYGSYLVISTLHQKSDLPPGVYLRTVWGSLSPDAIARLEVLRNGQAVPFKAVGTPACLKLEADGGRVEICLSEPKVIRLRGTGAGLRLSMQISSFEHALARPDGRWELNARIYQDRFMVSALQGAIAVDAPWAEVKCRQVVVDFVPASGSGVCEAAIESFRASWSGRSYRGTFEAAVAGVEKEFQRWLRKMPSAPEEWAEAREAAAYLLWSAVVAPDVLLKRPAMLMSKKWMKRVWSWDHCFNAWALVYGLPELAWDQLMLPFDHQLAGGALPDALSNNQLIWNFCKPPIHGWTLRRMRERTDWIDRRRMKEIYEPLGAWTRWWLKARDWDGDGVPQYNHGNDSGWDNATPFDAGPPVESPDLCAYLVIQMEELSELARRLGLRAQAGRWRAQAARLLERLMRHSWRGDRFVSPRSGDHRVVDGDSLLDFQPMVLGPRLPQEARAKLLAALKTEGRFLTPHGLATESPASRFYRADGYWRGPIWAPSTMIVVDGLRAAGETRFAADISRRFCRLCANGGFAENFDALTGAPLRDPAYTWTASVFLVLAHEYV